MFIGGCFKPGHRLRAPDCERCSPRQQPLDGDGRVKPGQAAMTGLDRCVWEGSDCRILGMSYLPRGGRANQDDGAGRCPVPCVARCHSAMDQGGPVASAVPAAPGADDGPSGLIGGSPMKKPRTWRSSSSFQMQPVPGAALLLVLLLDERLFAAGLLSHHGFNAAAEVMHDLEYPVPEFGGAEAGDDGEIAADVGDGAWPTARRRT